MRFVGLLPASVLLIAACSGASRQTDDGADSNTITDSETSGTTLTRSAMLANNTSGSSLFTDEYTPGTHWAVPTPKIISNGDAPASPITTADMSRGLVSKVPIWKLLYPTATVKPATKFFAETQGWFCTNGKAALSPLANADQCGGHIDIGYDSNAVAHVQAEVADMVSRGFDGALLDWSGSSAGLGSNTHSTNVHDINTGNMTAVMHAAEATRGKFQFAAVEDEGMQACAGDAIVKPKNGVCPSTVRAPNGCDVTQRVIDDVNFLAKNYFTSPAYQTLGGRPVVYFFGVDHAATDNCKSIVWETVRKGVDYPSEPVFVFEDATGFKHAESGGGYGWVKPTAIASYASSTDKFDVASYLPDFYVKAKLAVKADPSLFVLGSVFKGFDDIVVNGWKIWGNQPATKGNGNRYVGQQCGKTWIDSFGAASKAYPESDPIEAIQVPTWDDYEEATEIESGIENYADVTASMSGDTLRWNVAASKAAPEDCTAALAPDTGFKLEQTLDHFEVYASSAPGSDTAPLTLIDGDIPPTATSLDMTGKLHSGSYVLYVYAVGKPSIHNHMSAPVPFK